MLEDINNLFKKIFSNEETLVFSLLLLGAFFVLFFLGGILTPFLISIIFAYLLVGMQTRLESFGISTIIAFLITYSFFLLLGAALIVWLGPLVYQQLQSIILEVPKWLNSFIVFNREIVTFTNPKNSLIEYYFNAIKTHKTPIIEQHQRKSLYTPASRPLLSP